MVSKCTECNKGEIYAKKLCRNCYARTWRQDNPDKYWAIRISSNEKLGMKHFQIYAKEWAEKNRDRRKEYQRKYYLLHKENLHDI